MQYLPSLTAADTEVTLEKLDRVARTLSEKIKSFAKFFGVLLSWCIFNILIALFFSRTRSLSLTAYRMIADCLREVAAQDLTVYLAFFFESKINCVIASAAALFVCGGGYLHYPARVQSNEAEKKEFNYTEYSQNGACSDAYVIAYKQHVAFLA